MDEDWRNEYIQNFDVTPGGRARGVWPPTPTPKAPQNSFCTNIVMLYIKLKVMKSRIQWCKKKFAPGTCLGSLEVKK